MSTKIERRLKLRKKCNDETPLKHSKSLTLGSDRKSKSGSCSVTDFKCETLGISPLKVDINSEKRFRKKKIRSTQDFNRLNSSVTSQDSEESTKNSAKKTKKSKKVYNLPRISQVADYFSANSQKFSNEHIQKKKFKKSRKHTDGNKTSENPSMETRTITDKMKEDDSNGSNENLGLSSFSQSQSEQNIEKGFSTDEDSDEEFVIKDKSPKLKKKKHSASNINVNIETEKMNTAERYAKRIRKLLSDTLIRESQSNNTSNSSVLSTPASDRKLEQNKKISTKQIKVQVTPKVDKSTICMDDQGGIGKQSATARLSRKINSTPYPKTQEKLSVSKRRSRTNLENFLSGQESIKMKNKKSTIRSSTLTVNVSFDVDFDSDDDDVFNNTLENKFIDEGFKNETFSNNNATINGRKSSRKSVRFQSPGKNIRRETLILSKLTTENMTMTPYKSDNDDGTHTNSLSDGLSTTKGNKTFEITSPKIINQTNSYENVSQNEVSIINNSLNKQNMSYKYSKANTLKSPKRKSSSELLSPRNKSLRNSTNEKEDNIFNSIIDLTTPVPLKKIEPGVVPTSEKLNTNGLNDISVQLNREATFSKDDEESFSTQSAQLKDDNETLTNISFVPSLVRTATFIKDDETIKESQNLSPDLNYSPLPSNTSYSKILDTSKVNKRRRWDKSRQSISFLNNSHDMGNISTLLQENNSLKNLSNLNVDMHKEIVSFPNNSLNISNISAPWQESDDKILSNLEVSAPRQSFDRKCSPIMPSSSSTPYSKGKSMLLRQALLKNKQKMVEDDSKNCTVHIQKPLPAVRTKIPNFALIHQRAYDKLENIKEMSERKATRAKLLLSGRKPPDENIPKASTKRKELKFSPVHLKSSPSNETKNVNRSRNNKPNISVTKINNLSPSKSNLKVANKENKLNPLGKKKELLKAKSQLPKPKAVIAEEKGFTRFGFKVGSVNIKKASKEEQVKAVAAKSKIMKNTLEERRNVIQGVRSNRRFELLMKMRNK
ncbi:uncharacterized protein LOC108909169 [Anoplophora glabripennis]|uniref:uncharacterized protein LOC108909169 n=1 Tax=Anoplophora glabripennis TaxID=217634 RepID=UPI000873DFBA|nr:uncharacterized protein LOC108909169 [Anoplophora glabripennis]